LFGENPTFSPLVFREDYQHALPPFQCSLQPFQKEMMSPDNVGLWIMGREPQSPRAIGLGYRRLLRDIPFEYLDYAPYCLN
jgi:hypothetical protein